jgi:poly-gamma-glutamate synthase PgsB/CapB
MPWWSSIGLRAGHLGATRLLAIALMALAIALLWLAVSAWRHRRNLGAVAVRIHVAGTRGKSTTTRLIAAGLRAGGRQVIAKTTGSQPRLIWTDGSERDWRRWGPASVREQARLFAVAARAGADTVVVECMAIRPELVWASEAYLVQATMTVITNSRADHFEELGPDPTATAAAMQFAVPRGGRLVVAAEAATPALRAVAAARGCDVTVIDTEGLDPLDADRALARVVCAALGVAATVADAAMAAAAADPGGFFTRTLMIDGKTVHLASAFACNDVDSLSRLWGSVTGGDAPVVLLNARRDRPLRTQRFLAFLAAQAPRPLLFVTGDPLALRLARRAGFGPGAARRLQARSAAAALSELAQATAPGGVIWGVGNYQGLGAGLVEALSGRSAAC